ncbi:unnamed protein product [Paramecium primaurelia]|uniref:Protein kinase domain-containing protein n=1 Tax=Paramecium primaurelia TaxID=5886 RepID=A0A8S1LW87_PARPR|nr:unnamed protein product [Paramecium primaurelia]
MGICLNKQFIDQYEKLFSDHPDSNKAIQLYPAFSHVKIVHNDWYRLAKVEFNGLPHETEAFLKKWRSREQHPHLFLIHKIVTDETSRAVIYLDFPESIVTELDDESYLPLLDAVLQIMSKWQKQSKTYSYFGRDSVYKIRSFDGQFYYKILDPMLHPYLIQFYRKCWLQKNTRQLEQLLSKFYLSPIQLEALSKKVEYPIHNFYKTDVFCLGLFIYKCLTQDEDFYDLINYKVKLDKIRRNIQDLKLQNYAKMILLNMLEENEEDRPDFIQLELKFTHFSPELKYKRIFYNINSMIFEESLLQITQLVTEQNNDQVVPEEIQAFNFDERLDFENLHFSITTNTNPTAEIHKMVGKGFHSQMILNNNKQSNIELDEGVKRKTRIDLPCLGYADLSNWKTAEGMFTKGMLQGYARLTFSNGDKFEGFFVNNRANGKGTYIFHDNQYHKKEGTWKDNKFIITI